MRKQTNLAEVKLTALALLSTEINETPYSPMIVNAELKMQENAEEIM